MATKRNEELSSQSIFHRRRKGEVGSGVANTEQHTELSQIFPIPTSCANIVGDGGDKRVVALNALLQLLANGLRPDYTPGVGGEGGREGRRDPLLL